MTRSSRPPAPTDAIPLRRSAVDLAALLASTLEPLQEQGRAADIGVAIESTGTPPGPVTIDPEKIAWVVATVVGSAFRYVKRGTRVRPGGSIVVRIGWGDVPGHVVLRVIDDGCGIPKEKLPFLFERRAGAQHAAGLALMLVHDVVVAHGGEVHVESRTDALGHGTTVAITLPLIAPGAKAAPGGAPATP